MNHNFENIPEEEMNKQIVAKLVEDDLKEKYASIVKKEYQISKHEKKKKSNIVWLAAASLFILLMSVFMIQIYMGESAHQMAANLAKETVILGDQSVMRKDMVLIEELRMEANRLFIEEKFEEAALKYKALFNTGSVSESDYFYAAVSILKSKKPNAPLAIQYLEKVNPASQFTEETKWFKALAYTMNNDKEAARSLLEEIVKNHSAKELEAKKLLKLIK